MQDECTLEIMNSIRKLWHEDKQIVDIDQNYADTIINKTAITNGDDLKWLPLCTPEEIEYARGFI